MAKLGNVTIPDPVPVGIPWPFITDFTYSESQDFLVVSHRFQEEATLAVQRFAVGIGPRKFTFVKERFTRLERQQLIDFFDELQGSFQTFIYQAPQPDLTDFIPYTVCLETPFLSIEQIVNSCRTGLTFTEQPSGDPPIYTTTGDPQTRFPSIDLTVGLTEQVQVLIPLIHITTRTPDPTFETGKSGFVECWISDRLVQIDKQVYLPRLIGLGESGTGTIMSQDISGSADNVQFAFGNGDRVMTQLSNSAELRYASIELSFYHVLTGIVLNLWKGVITHFVSDPSAVFRVQASDGLFPIYNLYPNRIASRSCWKTYNDGINCPFAAKHDPLPPIIPGWNDAASGHPFDINSCDFGFVTPNGCYAHGMSKYFGAQPAQPQGVNIKDNSTGMWIFAGRNTVTSTSIISDSMWGKALQEIWCNAFGDPLKAFFVNAVIAGVRDESSYENVLGIVGVGPIGKFMVNSGPGGISGYLVQNADGFPQIIAPLADGFTSHGFRLSSNGLRTDTNTNDGLRQFEGIDPITNAGLTDGMAFALGQNEPGPNGTTIQEWFIQDIHYGQIVPFAAGVAICELRYVKPAGLNPTSAESHSMIVPIDQGLTGVVFDKDGGVTAVPGLTNPFWIAVNSYLRCLGLDKANSTVQSQYFDIDSTLRCAEVADTNVPDVFGFATEAQFQFQGAIGAGGERKPFRDWLTEILSCTLGFFSFSFGKLYLGIRDTPNVTSAFTSGSMLYQTLQLEPIEAKFEKITISYADRDYQYQANTIDYEDKDYSTYMGRAGSPLEANMHSVGLPTINQGLRVAVTRVREEIGGVLRPDQPNPYIEWQSARKATFKTTILALETGVGDVITITHPDIATYPGPAPRRDGSPGIGDPRTTPNTWKFRITRWTLHQDWSVTIEATSITDSMYDLLVGPPPMDVQPAPLPAYFHDLALQQWFPGNNTSGADATWPNEYTFGLKNFYTWAMSDGTTLAQLQVVGALPVTQYVTGSGAPQIFNGKVTINTGGGHIPGGVNVRICVCSYKAATNQYSPPSKVLLIPVPMGTNTNEIIIHDIVWPPGGPTDGWVIFASLFDDMLCDQAEGSGMPGDLILSGVTRFGGGKGLPDPDITEVVIKIKRLVHGGPLGAAVESIVGNTIVSSDAIDMSGSDNWAGRKLIIIGRWGALSPDVTFNIGSFDKTTGTFTLDRDPAVAGVLVGDAFVVSFLDDNTSTPTVLSDPGLSNVTNGHTGETPGDPNRIGNRVRVLFGLSRGLTATIIAVPSSTSYELDQPLPVDSTSIWIVEAPTWEKTQGHADVPQSNKAVFANIVIPVENYVGFPVLVGAFTQDSNGDTSGEPNALFRMAYIFGMGMGQRTVTMDGPVLPNDQLVLCDSTAGPFTLTFPPLKTLPQRPFIFKKVSDDMNVITVTLTAPDTLPDGVTTSFTLVNGGPFGDAWLVVPGTDPPLTF